MKLVIVTTLLFVASVCYGHSYGGYGVGRVCGGGFLAGWGSGYGSGIVKVAASPVVAVDGHDGWEYGGWGLGGWGYGGYGGGYGVRYGVRYGGGYGGGHGGYGYATTPDYDERTAKKIALKKKNICK